MDTPSGAHSRLKTDTSKIVLNMTTTTLRVHGLDCADEATELREALQSRPGVRELSFDLLRGLMIVEHDEATITRDDLIAAIAVIGLRAELECDVCPVAGSAPESVRGWRSVVTVASGVLLGAGFIEQLVTGGWLSLLGSEDASPALPNGSRLPNESQTCPTGT